MFDQPHYNELGIEPIDIMKRNLSQEEYKGFLVGNLVKYSHRKKGQELQDAQKIQVYARWLELLYDTTQIDEKRALNNLIKAIPKDKYSIIVSEGRGGAYVAAQVAYALDLPLYVGKGYHLTQSGRALFIDDIEDSSHTVEEVHSYNVDVGVLVQKASSKRLADYVGLVVDTDDYINFTFQSKDKNESNKTI
jgi:hypoxanthine phosphoribosyltransferase